MNLIVIEKEIKEKTSFKSGTDNKDKVDKLKFRTFVWAHELLQCPLIKKYSLGIINSPSPTINVYIKI